MNQFAVLAAVAALVMLFVFAEVAAAVLPLIVVLAVVPPGQRRELAELIAACDSSRRLRLWRALRVAVKARRRARNHFGPRRDTGTPLNDARGREPLINAPRVYGSDLDRSSPNPAGPSSKD